MVIAVAAFGLALHPDREAVGTGIGSAAPTPRRARDAEAVPRAALSRGLWESRGALPDRLGREFGELVARGRLADRRRPRHRGVPPARARRVMARRTLTWAWNDYRRTRRALS